MVFSTRPASTGFVEEQCAKFYSDRVGRPSLAPGHYFRMLPLGYFKGVDSERAIAWREVEAEGGDTMGR